MAPDRPADTGGVRLSASAALVAAGMFVSRISGFIRSSLLAGVFGQKNDYLDAFNQALRIPNFLQNLLGEGVLSASLIPVYASLVTSDRAHADQVARSVLRVLAFVTACLVVAGIASAPLLQHLVAPGFVGEKREFTIYLVRILFPGVGLLVMSAWCLAVLNSHHKFFLSYVAPVAWNAALIGAVVLYRHEDSSVIAVRLAWGATIGAGLQLGVQLPFVWRLMAPHWAQRVKEVRAHVRHVVLTSVPVIFTRGAVQISAFIDGSIASFLGTGAVTALANAQQLFQLPVSLFGMAVSSAALPSMSASMATQHIEGLRARLVSSQETIAVLVVPSTIAFLAFGDVMVAMLFQHGRFAHDDTIYTWAILAGSGVGLLATTVGRLYSSAFYALGETRTPTRFAIVRVIVVGVVGYPLAVWVPPALGWPAQWGAPGLTMSAGLAGWIEFALLRRALGKRLGPITIPIRLVSRAWAAAILSVAVAAGLRWLPIGNVVGRGLLILGVYGLVYLAVAQSLGLLAVAAMIRRVLRMRRI